MSYIDNNTVFTSPTYFSRGVELIEDAHSKYKDLPTENWSLPVGIRFGDPLNDKYYAEIWVDGMDWNYIYWLIEHNNISKPNVCPLLFFADSINRHKIKGEGFREICNAIMYYRRDILWLNTGRPTDFYNDIVWPFFTPVILEDRMKHSDFMIKYQYYHASQSKVEMYVNQNLIPLYKKQSNTSDNNITITTEYPKGVG